MSSPVVLVREAFASLSGVITSLHGTIKLLIRLMAVIDLPLEVIDLPLEVIDTPLEVSHSSAFFNTIWIEAHMVPDMVALMMPGNG